MELKLGNAVEPTSPTHVNLRCPLCRHQGAFGGLSKILDARLEYHRRMKGSSNLAVDHLSAGIRICPNADCRAVIFVVLQKTNLVASYPPEVIDFDATNLPERLLSSLEEAIKCHSIGCYKAAALMVRRALEELCEDKGAKGKSLKDRLASLKGAVLIPDDLLNAADELRLLGNDAAHIEAKDYDKIGREEVEIAIELAKELLKAVYQYTSLVGRLQALKKSP